MSELPHSIAGAGTALADLRAEISLLRRGIEALTAERQAAPDYAPTLNATAERLDKMVAWMRKVAGTPLLQFTPERLQKEINRVAVEARADEHKATERARADLQKATREISQLTESAINADEQLRILVATGLSSFLGGMLLVFSLIEMDRPVAEQSPPIAAQAPVPAAFAGEQANPIQAALKKRRDVKGSR